MKENHITRGRLKVVFINLILAITILSASYVGPQLESSVAAAQLLSIPACTSTQLALVEVYLLAVVADMNDLNTAIEAFDLEGMRETAIAMHQNWFDDSPDIPYCAQGVHSRLLVDRVVEILTIMSVSLSYGDTDIYDEYAEMLDSATQDLGTYSEILESYQ